MGIEDIQISEELETNAPSIKYSGNEGPKSPQQMQEMMMAQLEEEYLKYVDEMIEMGREPMSMQQFMDQAMAEGQMAGGNPLPQDPTKPVNPFQPKPTGPVLPDRQMAAYGGIMGIDGRRQYGLGSSFKKFVRKVIPNEVAAVAEKAAPFIALAAPQFALPAAIAGGLGSFDRTGRIGSSLMSGLQTYGLGQLSDASGLAPFKNVGPSQGIFSKTGAMGGKYNVKDILGRRIAAAGDAGRITAQDLGVQVGDNAGFTKTANEGVLKSLEGTSDYFPNLGGKVAKKQSTNLFGKAFTELPGLVKKNLQAAGLGNNLVTGLLVGGLGAGALMGGMTEEEQAEMNRGEGMDVEAIRQEVLTAMKDPTGDALKAIRIKYPFLGRQDTKDIDAMGKAMGGRIGYADAGSVMKDPDEVVAGMDNELNPGITDQLLKGIDRDMGVDLIDKIQGLKYGKDFLGFDSLGYPKTSKNNPMSMEQTIQYLENLFDQHIDEGNDPRKGGYFHDLGVYSKDDIRRRVELGFDSAKGPETQTGIMKAAYGGRIGKAEGGIMDLGGMEKDYRAEGGFVPIGREEKADDVPARLSVNEFVFTADAVRNAGGGDIDRGAEVMENMMKHLEQGGQVSDESQGMAGAQQMFETSERLSEVM